MKIGGKSYICPRKSVSISTFTAVVVHSTATVTPGLQVTDSETLGLTFETPRVTTISDVVFDNYHVFGSEVRITPADGAGSQEKTTSPDATKPASPPR